MLIYFCVNPKERGLAPEEVLADTLYGSDEPI